MNSRFKKTRKQINFLVIKDAKVQTSWIWLFSGSLKQSETDIYLDYLKLNIILSYGILVQSLYWDFYLI